MNLRENFYAAYRVGTPAVAVRTPDPKSAIAVVKKALLAGKLGADYSTEQAEVELNKLALAQWDGIHGLSGLNDNGTNTLAKLIQNSGMEPSATVELAIALGIVEPAGEVDLVLFIHNPHLFWQDPRVIQGLWNLRDKFKANGNIVVSLLPLGTLLPIELNNDTLLLEEQLPNRDAIKTIIRETFKFAKVKKTPDEKFLDRAADAVVGIPAFPIEQATAMHLDKNTGELDIKGMFDRKRGIIEATNGLNFVDTNLKLADCGGNDNIKNYLSMIMNGKRRAQLLLRIDEMEKMFAGAGTDTSGVKGDMLGNFLSWVEAKKILCMLFLGVPGTSKSFITECVGGEFGIPVIDFDISGMQDSLVGNSGKNLRAAEATVEAISDGQIIICATANSLRGLPAELLSRFEKGGIFFFDAPETDAERQTILNLKIKKFGLTPEQTKDVPDMTDWTGREIDSMCDKADLTNGTLMSAGQYVVPLLHSHAGDMEDLRASASQRFLSASKPGLYNYVPKQKQPVNAAVEEGRRIRD